MFAIVYCMSALLMSLEPGVTILQPTDRARRARVRSQGARGPRPLRGSRIEELQDLGFLLFVVNQIWVRILEPNVCANWLKCCVLL